MTTEFPFATSGSTNAKVGTSDEVTAARAGRLSGRTVLDWNNQIMNLPAPGRIEVITGPMFSGKSEELIRRLKRARIARQRVACYKPDIDLRYHRTAIASHSAQTLDAVTVANVEELKAVLTIIRMGRGLMMGVDHNRNLRWVGASAPTILPGPCSSSCPTWPPG